jgi:hypothetical protein
MKALLLVTGSGPLAVLTSHASPTDPVLVKRLRGKGIKKFVAFDIPIEIARQRYGGHFTVVERDLRQTDDLRILDYDGHRVLRLFRFDELGSPVFHEGGEDEMTSEPVPVGK